ncbi:hypothetical protein B5G43_04175 [Flavonifractor sp. An92]|uniref:protein-export chaperone SecB n=1 Tax=Flavonifractor sp. An92 TaxID=1965666 RepID=UPI000B3ADEA2|nr:MULTISPECIES: protein-export chaperone SecB [unclassified Flavonifractor]OUN07539.1 hypothetical protein B5G43_04175 [Flavonifractor sp. An92]OUQ22353.1 hypothetical protein B5E80_14465 [Flavonifractor sp. An135]
MLNASLNSVVELKHLYIGHISFSRTSDKIDDNKLTISFKKSYDFNEEHNACKVTLGCSIKNQDSECINLQVDIIGHFTCNDESLERREQLLTKNTLAILFPYLRSQISLITAQPELTPIVLPPMNIEAVFDLASDE